MGEGDALLNPAERNCPYSSRLFVDLHVYWAGVAKRSVVVGSFNFFGCKNGYKKVSPGGLTSVETGSC